MKINNDVTLPFPAADVWPLLLDIPMVARCVPGATLTEELDNNRYRGKVSVKVGPVALTFAGELDIVAMDQASRTAKLLAKGNDAKGRGTAIATVDIALKEQEAGSLLAVSTDLQLTGSVAQYGRAEGLLKAVANEIAAQFVSNLQKEVGRQGTDVGTDLPTSSPSPHQVAKPLSAFGLAWTIIKGMFARSHRSERPAAPTRNS